MLRPNLPGRFGVFFPGRLGVTEGSAAAAGATVSPSLDSAGRECFATNLSLSFQGPSIAEQEWASGKFKLMPGAGCAAGLAPDVRDPGRLRLAASVNRSPAPHPEWVSGKFKSMSGPVTSWPGPEARRDPRRTSDTSQKVPSDVSGLFSGYIPCINTRYHHGMHAGSVMVQRAGCYA